MGPTAFTRRNGNADLRGCGMHNTQPPGQFRFSPYVVWARAWSHAGSGAVGDM